MIDLLTFLQLCKHSLDLFLNYNIQINMAEASKRPIKKIGGRVIFKFGKHDN